MTDRDKIARYYDEGAQHELLRLDTTPLREAEWQLSIELIDEHITEGAMVLDVGAGPGRYAEHLIKHRRCRVGLVDLSQTCLDKFAARIDSANQDRVLFSWRACATDLSFIPSDTFDAVLLMGPLYHLLQETERLNAIVEAKRILNPGGMVFATFISIYPVIPRLLTHDTSLLFNTDFIDKLLDNGTVTSRTVTNMTDHYRCWPEQARMLMEKGGFTTRRLRNLEGVGAFFQREQRNILTDSDSRAAWFAVLRRTCELPDLLGATEHFLYMGEKC